MTNEAVKKQITKARIAMLQKQPFYGTLALRLRMREMEPAMIAAYESKGQRATLAVDGKSVFYNPEFVATLSHQLTMSAIAHEVGHCVFAHIGRRGGRDPRRWNMAGDYVINAALKNADFEIDDSWLYNPAWGADKSADWIYNQIPPQDESGGGSGDGQGDPLCDILDGESKEDPQLQDDWKLATAQAAAVAHQAGKLPADMKRFVDELLNPKTDWRTQLRRFVTERSKSDYSWARPNRKMLGAHGLYMPSLYSERMGTIAIGIDTSGSITQKMLNIFASEINAIRSQVNPEKTVVIYCDAQINKVVEFTAEDVLELEMIGGGSTDFRPPFEHLAENNIVPAAMLYMTDLYGPAPEVPPAYPVMWCCTTSQEEPWGERVQIDLED